MPSKLPNCQLIEVLRAKAAARTDVEFNYLARLEDFRHHVGAEVRFINQLFSEYTPHDEEYHLSRLFHVADTLIGLERYELMNATELFVLACGLYGHDWGMAVSDAERRYIISGNIPEGSTPSDFALLRDETQTFKRFAAEKGTTDDDLKEDKVSIEDWREYVRRTHAYRSGERVRHYFRNIDSGIAEAAGRVCEGHWLDINVLQDYRQFPPNFAVLRENLNLAALAVYVRLVDLLDIGHDRTPYVIWKFVAPRDQRSQMEWNKHRSLQPITCPQYLNGRIILVDGSTSDTDVYAALEDLHIYCEAQVRECMDLLAYLGDYRHQLDFYHVEWRVAPRGFDPIPIRFEFARDRVFEILSDEIYQGDPYVFLRELLQNSIDAIRMRREILKRRAGITLDTGLIKVEVKHGDKGDAIVTWVDDGIGMDAYVVRNYLAVAGKSYYRSEDFERQGLNLDPISRFGIGILSCFMVAEQVEIKTYKDPYAPSSSGDPLHIKIPSVTRQFRVEKCSSAGTDIGTKVIVYVEGRRLPKSTTRLNVTEYLKRVAGFVEFPILISEDESHTLILHPKSSIDPSAHQKLRQYHNIKVHRISLEYPFEGFFYPQDVEDARAVLVENVIDLEENLRLTNYEGRITYLEPREKFNWIMRDYSGTYSSNVRVINRDRQYSVIIRWGNQSRQTNVGDISPSAKHHPNYAIYRDGILVPNATSWPRSDMEISSETMPQPQFVINLSSKAAPELDLSRLSMRSGSTHWSDRLSQALDKKLEEELLRDIQDVEGCKRLMRFGLFLSSHNLDKGFIEKVRRAKLPVPLLSTGGKLEVLSWQTYEGKPVRRCPEQLNDVLGELINDTCFGKGYDGFLTKWNGEDAVIANTNRNTAIQIEAAIGATRLILGEDYEFAEVVLLEPPLDNLPPLVQEVWYPKGSQLNRSVVSIAEEGIENPFALTQRERNALLSKAQITWRDKFTVIPDYHIRPLRVGNYLFNIAHPVGDLIFRSIAAVFLAIQKGQGHEVRLGKLKDAINNFTTTSFDYAREEILNNHVLTLMAAASEVGVIMRYSQTPTIKSNELWYVRSGYIRSGNISLPNIKQSFGKPLAG